MRSVHWYYSYSLSYSNCKIPRSPKLSSKYLNPFLWLFQHKLCWNLHSFNTLEEYICEVSKYFCLNIYIDYTVNAILRHLLYLYFKTRKASIDTLLASYAIRYNLEWSTSMYIYGCIYSVYIYIHTYIWTSFFLTAWISWSKNLKKLACYRVLSLSSP